MNSRLKVIACLMPLVFYAFTGVSSAQIAKAVVVGRVQDSSGAAMVGVAIQMKRPSTNEVFRTTTTETGDYTLASLPVGTFDIQASMAGFATQARTGIVLEIGQTYRIDFVLNVGI